MSGGGRWPRLLGLLAVAAVAVMVWIFVLATDGYARLAERVGPERAELMVNAVLPLALARHCHDAFGEDQALVEAVAGFILDNQAAIAALNEGPAGVQALSDREKEYLEEEALRRATDIGGGRQECGRAALEMAEGRFDLPEARQLPND